MKIFTSETIVYRDMYFYAQCQVKGNGPGFGAIIVDRLQKMGTLLRLNAPHPPVVFNNVPDLFQIGDLSVSHMNAPFLLIPECFPHSSRMLKLERQSRLFSGTIVNAEHLIKVFLVSRHVDTHSSSFPENCQGINTP